MNFKKSSVATLFFDCANSSPASFEFKVGQILSYCGEEFSVASVELLFDENSPHHFEITLV